MSLSQDDIARSLKNIDGWQRSGIEIPKTFDRRNTDGSMRFINAVAAEANAQDIIPTSRVVERSPLRYPRTTSRRCRNAT